MKVKQLLTKMMRYSTIDMIEVYRESKLVLVYDTDDIMEENWGEYGSAKINTFGIRDRVMILNIE